MSDRWDVPPFPGAVGVTHLSVYDSVGPDGKRGGTPHVHSVCTEAYFVVAGTGAVETLTMAGYREVPLEAGVFVWFTPGTIHRLVNGDGHLEILVVMSNAGLPEAGDMVITFPQEILEDPVRYRSHSILPESESTTDGSGRAARARRDLGVEGFVQMRDALRDGRTAPLSRFYDQVAVMLAPRAPGWRSVFAGGVVKAMYNTKQQLEAMERADPSHMSRASVHELGPTTGERRLGCCGTLGTYLPLR